MKEKYVEERFPRYMEFGTSLVSMMDFPMVDVASVNIDTIVTVGERQAKVLIEDHNKAIDMLINLMKL